MDEAQRRQYCAALTVGASPDDAADFARVAPHDVAAAIAADPDFAQEIRHCQAQQTMHALKGMHDAMGDPKNWRACAWYLKHARPDQFGRKAKQLGIDDVGQAIAWALEILLPFVAEDRRHEALDALNRLPNRAITDQ